MTELKLGPINVKRGGEKSSASRMALLLWGPATVGKTAWAATAPGVKLWITFGDNEHQTVEGRHDVYVADWSSVTTTELFRHAKGQNPFGLDKFLTENTEVDAVVVDSVTALTYRALQYAVEEKVGKGKDFTPTMETPGMSAYGARNSTTIEVISGILRVTAKHGVHCIIIGHEDDPTFIKDDKGNNTTDIDYYGIMLGGKITPQVTWRLSEIWWMHSQGDERRISVRQHMRRRPIKTRIFESADVREFRLDYDIMQPDDAPGQMTIAGFYQQWLDSGMGKIPVPDNIQRAEPRRRAVVQKRTR